MTPDERNLLSNFLNDLARARAQGKDVEADRAIAEAFAANPDAAYLIVQHAILSDEALHAAQDRIAELEAAQAPAPQAAPSFLGGLFNRPQAGGPSTAVPTTAPQPSPFAPSGGLGSFLRQAGATAAGVAGGELLFDGLSGLFGGHRGFGFGGMGGGFGMGGMGYGGGETVIVNNYDDGNRDGGGVWDNQGDMGGTDWGSDNN